jgi:hypothetical protein
MEVVAIERIIFLIAASLSAATAGCGATESAKSTEATPAPSGASYVPPAATTGAEVPSSTSSEIKQASHAAEIAPISETTAAKPAPTPAELVAKAEAFYAGVPNYTCRITRQERLGNRLQPAEKMLLHFRSKPRSVYYRWVGEACNGRECVWVENAHDGKIVTKGGKNDFGIAGKRVSVAPDSILAKSRSRYVITESGQDKQVKKLRDLVDRCANGSAPPDTLKYVGISQPPGSTGKLHHVVETIPPNGKLFPNGGVRDWRFDPETGRIVMVEAKDPAGERLEFYQFEHLVANNTLTDADFNPDIVFNRPATEADSAGKAEPPK